MLIPLDLDGYLFSPHDQSGKSLGLTVLAAGLFVAVASKWGDRFFHLW